MEKKQIVANRDVINSCGNESVRKCSRKSAVNPRGAKFHDGTFKTPKCNCNGYRYGHCGSCFPRESFCRSGKDFDSHGKDCGPMESNDTQTEEENDRSDDLEEDNGHHNSGGENDINCECRSEADHDDSDKDSVDDFYDCKADEKVNSEEELSDNEYHTCPEFYNPDYSPHDIKDKSENIDVSFENAKKSQHFSNSGQTQSRAFTAALRVPLSRKTGICKSKRYDSVMEKLEEYQAQSRWVEHKSLTSFLEKNESNLDLKVVLFLEQGMAEIMQNRFSAGKKFFRDALRLSSRSMNVSILQGRALMFLGNAYREESPKKYGKAFQCLMQADQILCSVESGEDKAELNYFLGVLLLNFSSQFSKHPSQKLRERIEKHYQAVYDYAMADSASRVHERVKRIFPLGMANFCLDCRTEAARARLVPEKRLKRAEDCLKYFKQNFPFDEQPITMQTDYYKSLSDLEFRRENFDSSQKFLEEGLKIAREHSYYLEIQYLEKRMAMLQKVLPRVSVCLKGEDTAGFADNSATANSDINVLSSGSD